MTNDIEASLKDLRLRLEKLRGALNHWHELELDYEGLKDEFSQLPEDASQEECLGTGLDFEPVKVDHKELLELIEPSQGTVRNPSQVIKVLADRINYVSRNVSSLQSQIGSLEQSIEETQPPDPVPESDHSVEGDPLTEIVEELDENGDVIRSDIFRPGEQIESISKNAEDTSSKTAASNILPEGGDVSAVGTTTAKPKPTIVSKAPTASAVPIGSKVQTAIPLDSRTNLKPIYDPSGQPPAIPADISAAEMLAMFNEASRDDSSDSSPILEPVNVEDSAEEARVRQEMLKYSLDDVNSIVAELELDERSEASDDDVGGEHDLDLEDLSDYDDDSGESEDEKGMSKSRLSDEYKQEMQRLEKQLGLQMENVGPVSGMSEELKKLVERPTAAAAARQAALKRAAAAEAETSKGPSAKAKSTTGEAPVDLKPKKSVAFAKELDIAPTTSSSQKVETSTKDSSHARATGSINGDIVERDVQDESADDASIEPAQPVSRFKASRQTRSSLFPPAMPSRTKATSDHKPPTAIIANSIVEKSSTPSKRTIAPDGDNFDVELQKRQMALEHHVLRNRRVHQRGGYVNSDDEDTLPDVIDTRTGETRKMSRFKAARVQT